MLWIINVALVAAWVMMSGMSRLSTDALTSTVGKNMVSLDPYPVQRFSTVSQDQRRSYLDLIRGIRDMLEDSALYPDTPLEIRRLADRASVDRNRRFLLVELINANEDTITVVLDTTRLYVVGYRRTNEFHYFPDTAEGVDTLFPGLPHTVLPFNSSYGGLAGEAGNRASIPLGMAPLEQAIDDLQAYRRPNIARAFTVIIQMLSEAIRYSYIENFIGNIIRRQSPHHDDNVPSATMLDLENEWGALSNRIQESVDFTLDPPVQITNREGVRNYISTFTQGLALNIGILFFVCNRPSNNANRLQLISTTPLHMDGIGTNYANISKPIIRLPTEKSAGHMELADGDICKNVGEPTVRIVGRNGLCADVRDGFYNDGNPIQLWPCKSNEDANQLWTLKADRTIRSNGKCLTTYGYAPGHYIMIYDCTTAALDATKWEIWYNGTIINPRSSLVLSATSGNQRTTLTVETNVYSTSQAWVVANNTQPILTPIINNGNRCLESYDANQLVYCNECESGQGRQLFAVYPDGSIRPDNRRDHCLTARTDSPIVSNTLLYANLCVDQGVSQRWSFNRDYTITNLGTGLAMDARRNEYNLVPLSPVVDMPRDSQEWHAWLI